MTQTNSTTKDLASLVLKKLEGAKISSPQPSEKVLNNLFEILFYTSIKTEEGQFIKVTITLIDPDEPDPSPPARIVANRWNSIHFEEKIPFTVKNLVKLSKAADPWSSSLAVYYNNNNELEIWGMIDQSVHYQSFLNYETEEGPEQPGLFQTTITGIGCLVVLFEYELIATLKQNVLISNYIDVFNSGVVSDVLSSNSKALKAEIQTYNDTAFPNDDISDLEISVQSIINESLSRILLRVQNYQHGGALLITPEIKFDLDIKYKLSYERLSQSIIDLAKLTIEYTNHSNNIHNNYFETNKKTLPFDLYLDEDVSDFTRKETSDELKGAIRFISSLSCIDGLVVLSPDMKVKGFGAVINSKDLPVNVYTSKTSIVIESNLSSFSPNHFGTRHRSMFSYCWNNPGSIGFVVSQDGDIRAIMRVKEKLIMWENIKVQQFIRSTKLKKFFALKKIK